MSALKASKNVLTIIHAALGVLFGWGAVNISFIIIQSSSGLGIISLMLWMGLNFIPFGVAIIFGDNTQGIVGTSFYICVALQWSVIGAYISMHVLKRKQ